MRLFVAVNLPEEERARLYDAAAELRNGGFPVRWVARDALHLTLKFLGDVAEAQVSAIESVLGAVAAAYSPVWLGLGGVGAFPNLRNPRVVWLGVEQAPELLSLQRDVERGLEPLGFAPEQRPYSPHLTLGRARRGTRAGDFLRLASMAQSVPYEAAITVNSVDLMRSHLSPGGARYERIAAIPLPVLERE